LPPARPTGLEIPSIGLSIGTLVDLSPTANGVMEVPGEARSVGWLTTGPTPGEPGTAVVSGHTGYGYLRGAFHRLGEVRPGDLVLTARSA
jgi:sortase (surface protein transpeptidase)